MRQFDVCRGKSGVLLLVLQHDAIEALDTRIVAPLIKNSGRKLIGRARLLVELEGTEYMLQLDRLAAIDARHLGPVVGSLGTRRDDIKNGIDLLFFGF
jgi:CcdB protein